MQAEPQAYQERELGGREERTEHGKLPATCRLTCVRYVCVDDDRSVGWALGDGRGSSGWTALASCLKMGCPFFGGLSNQGGSRFAAVRASALTYPDAPRVANMSERSIGDAFWGRANAPCRSIEASLAFDHRTRRFLLSNVAKHHPINRTMSTLECEKLVCRTAPCHKVSRKRWAYH